MHSAGYKVFIVTRNLQHGIRNEKTGQNIDGKIINSNYIGWDYKSPFPSITTSEIFSEHVTESTSEDFNKTDLWDAVINFTGESIGSARWTKEVRDRILKSRIETTAAIVNAINNGSIRTKVFINASAVGYYGHRRDETLTESDGPGEDFLARVCKKWEEEAYRVGDSFLKEATPPRVVTLRTGVVLGSEGALKRMVMPFKFFIGGPLGKGDQWLPWIHIRDLTAIVRFITENCEIIGPVNVTTPNPVRMKEFSNTLGEVLKRPSWLPVPEFALKIALGRMSEMLLHGQRAVPAKISSYGFEFKYPELREALEEVIQR